MKSWLLLITLVSGAAAAQERGFRAHLYDGSSAGSAHFLVERPWYSALRFGAAGLTLDYSRRPLVPRLSTGQGAIEPIVSNALVGHVDLAGSLFDRLVLSASLPITLLETGTTELVSQAGPLQTVGLGDPRVGLMVRVAGQADRDAFSLHLGADLWIPIGAQATHQGDRGLRFMPRAVLAGAFAEVGRWTLDAAFLFRPYASIGPPALGMTAASELRVGLGLGASLLNERLFIGPEARLAMQVVGQSAFGVNGMSLELLGGAQYLVADQVLVGLAGGTAFFGAAGTPDARAILRLAWAPRRSASPDRVAVLGSPGADDPDSDGIATADDRCPFEPETRNGVRDADGCPELEMSPGSPLARVLAPVRVVGASSVAGPATDGGAPTVSGSTPFIAGGALAFLALDSDDDGVPDEADRCPVAPEDVDGFEDEDGCPELDNDGDTVPDAADRCPTEAETMNGLDDGDGCPDLAPDADADGVADGVDRCPFEPETIDGVRDEDGCPEHLVAESAAVAMLLTATPAVASPTGAHQPAALAPIDSDRDGVVDEADRCPLTPEDVDGFEDEDGCRESDDDEDGIADANDKCPLVAETVNGWKDEDGCPDEHEDVDGDGVLYEADRCPLEPGTSIDGCPRAVLPNLALAGFPGAPRGEVEPSPEGPTASTVDFDRDGVPDDADPCPVSPEDRDGFEDEDGCAEPDNDHDGIEDAKDKCPFVAESINGNEDTDGCPDVGAGAVTIQQDAVVIDGVVRFMTSSATLQPASLPLLQQVASTLRAAASLSIEIQGHTDDVGSAAQNVRLSQRRAEAIRAVLIRFGVAPARLLATGFGPTRPRASNKTPEGREQNRRVEFLILGGSK